MGTGKQYDEEFKKQAIKLAKEIGKFVLLGTNWDEHAHSLRIRFKIVQ